MRNLLAGLAEALAEGAIIIPNIIFAGLLYEHYGNYDFLLPFVLLYAFEKAAVFAVQGFGAIKNPYKILEYSLLLAIGGAFLCIFGRLHPLLWEAGAIFVGIGLANYSALFRTVRDSLIIDHEWNYKSPLLLGYFFLSVVLIFAMFLRHQTITLVFLVFFLMLIGVFIFVHGISKRRVDYSGPLFGRRINAWLNFLPAVTILLFTFFIRILKQTSDVRYLLYIGLAFSVILILVTFVNKPDFSIDSLATVWFGAVRNFLIIFSLMYFVAIDRGYMVNLSYLMVGVGVVLAMVVKKKIGTLFPNRNPEIISMILAMFSLLLLFSLNTYLVGVALSCAFVAAGNGLVLQKFTENKDLPVLERRVVRSKYYSFGAVFQQGILLLVLVLVSWLINTDGGTALGAYALHKGDPGMEITFFVVKLVAVILIDISGILLIMKIKRNSNVRADDFNLEKLEISGELDGME